MCRVREIEDRVTKCYKCLGFGHLSFDCKGTSRGNICWWCSKTGHIAKDCIEKVPHCVLCADTKSEDTRHRIGSANCAIYKEALQKRTRR